MPDYALADRLTELHGHGVADQTTNHLEIDLAIFWREPVVTWEALKHGSFS